MIGCDFTGSTDNRYGADGYDKEIDAGVSFVCKGSLFFFLGSDGVFTRCTRNFLDGRGKEPVRLPALRGQVLLLSRRRRGNGTRPADSSFLDGVYDRLYVPGGGGGTFGPVWFLRFRLTMKCFCPVPSVIWSTKCGGRKTAN